MTPLQAHVDQALTGVDRRDWEPLPPQPLRGRRRAISLYRLAERRRAVAG